MNAPLRLRWDHAAIAERVARLGEDIARDYAGRDLLLVTVLKGGAVFLADLVRTLPATVGVDFLAVRGLHHGRGADSQPVALTKDLDSDIAGRHVLVVEDIVDSGITLAYLLRVLAARQPASLSACTLLDRAEHRVVRLPLRYVGFATGPALLVGYGLDLDGWYRNLRDLWEVTDEAAARRDPAAALATTARAPGAPLEGRG